MDDFNNAGRDRRPVLLMTEGSSNSARQALYALGSRYTIDVLDPSPLCQCRFSRFVRRWYKCPSFAKDPCGYLAYLGRLLRERRYDVLFPVHEEVYLLSRVREALAQRIAAVIPDFSAVQLLHSKIKFIDLLRELQLPHPQSTVVATRAEMDTWSSFPCFLKLEGGTAGQGVRMARSRNELHSAVRSFEDQGKWSVGTPLLLQRPAVGDQSVVRAVFRQGELVGIHMSSLRMRGVGGAAMARVSCFHLPVIDHVRQIGERLTYHGPMFLEYFFDHATNTPQYIEADPRVGDSANATLCGINICQLCVEVATGQSVRRVPPSAPSGGVRSHAGFLLLIAKALDGANRRQIAAEMWRQWRGQSVYAESCDEITRPRLDWLSMVPYAWVAGRLLLRPSVGETIVRRTVENYALTAEAADRIAGISAEQLAACLDAAKQKHRASGGWLHRPPDGHPLP